MTFGSEYTLVDLQTVSPDRAVHLLTSSFGSDFLTANFSSTWKWRHIDNPAGLSVGTAAQSINGELVGLRPFMLFKMACGEQYFTAARAGDTAVHPNHQRKGLFSKLTIQSVNELKEKNIPLIFNTPNKKSGPGYAKLGWTLLGHPILWIRINKPNSFIKSYLLKIKSETTDFNFDYGDSVDSNFDEFNKIIVGANVSSNQLHILKDNDYLHWRYAEHPFHNYRMIVKNDKKCVSQHGNSNEIIIFREDQRGFFRGIAIVEQFYSDFSSCIKSIINVSHNTNADYTIMSDMNDFSTRLELIKHGFFPIRWKNVNFAVNVIQNKFLANKPFSVKNWKLTLGDLELF